MGYSLISSKWSVMFLEVLNFNQLFLKLNQFICNLEVDSPRSWGERYTRAL